MSMKKFEDDLRVYRIRLRFSRFVKRIWGQVNIATVRLYAWKCLADFRLYTV